MSLLPPLVTPAGEDLAGPWTLSCAPPSDRCCLRVDPSNILDSYLLALGSSRARGRFSGRISRDSAKWAWSLNCRLDSAVVGGVWRCRPGSDLPTSAGCPAGPV